MLFFTNMMNCVVKSYNERIRKNEAHNARINKWISCAKINPLFQCEQRENDVPHVCMLCSHDIYLCALLVSLTIVNFSVDSSSYNSPLPDICVLFLRLDQRNGIL